MKRAGTVGSGIRTWLGVSSILLSVVGLRGADLVEFPQLKCSATGWTVEDGLPGNALSALAPTRDGYLWVGGLNGLARFDGVRFVRFRLSDGLTSLQIVHLLEDKAGRLWIGTDDGGVIVREHGQFRSFAKTNGLGGDNVRALAEDAEGRIWVAHEQGLARWEGGRFVDMALPQDPSKRLGCASVFCGSNTVWSVSNDSLVREWRDGQWHLLPALQRSGVRFQRVFQTRDGVLWSQLMPYGLARLQGDMWQIFDGNNGLPTNYITSVLEQDDGSLLCGSFDQGLFSFRAGRGTPVGLNESPEMDGVLSLQQDRLGNLWMGTKTRGLQRLRQSRVHVVAGSERVRIARMAVDTQGRFWFGSGEELWFEQQEQLVAVTPPSVPSFRIAALKPRAAGGVWISVQGRGLWQFDPDRHDRPVQKLRAGRGDPSSAMMLAEDGASGFWYATSRGVVGRLTESGTNPVARLDLPENKNINGLMADPRGVWVKIDGTGLVRLDATGKELERVTPEHGLPVNSIRCWLPDSEGGLWIGTPAGLYWWRHSKLLAFDTRHGLPEEVIANLIDDLSGHLWCAANNYLFRLTKQQLEKVATQKAAVLHPLVIGGSDGMKPVPFAAGVASRAVRAPNGRLFFPRIWDVISLDPAEFAQAEPAPRVLIEEVFLDGQPMGSHASSEKPLRVPAGPGEIMVRYTALQCAAPEKLHFRYRLDGADKAWTDVGDQRVVRFRRLPPGEYRFHVTAAAAGGAWAEPGAIINWRVAPFFWQTVWFRVTGLAVGLGALGLLAWKRVRTVEQRRAAQELFSRRLLETQEVERRRIAAELHDGLGQNLVLVKNLALLEERDSKPQEETRPRSGEIVAAAERALEEVHAISYALRPPELDRLGLSKALAGLVRRAGDASGIRFQSDIATSVGTLPTGADIQLFRIAQEAVNNLVKHSGAKTARVEFWQDEGGVHLIVADDGRGMATPAENSHSRNGLGLSGIEERARLIGAHCKWLSHPGQGTTLSVLVKI